jgi:GntR family transcriptional regulator/MocR family aminotransferase
MNLTGRPQAVSDAARHGTLQAKIYEDLRHAIQSGRIASGAKLPSIRSLASELGVARGTVEAVYARLAGEGRIVTRGPAGTMVSPTFDLHQGPRARPKISTPAQPTSISRRFHIGLPALDLFPYAHWARLVTQQARRLSIGAPHHPNPAGLPALREAVAGYLAVARGVACDPSQVFITAGYQGALDLAMRLLLRERNQVWFEDPGYAFARDAVRSRPVRLVPVPVDAEGLRVDEGLRMAPRARMAIVTPSHQSPLTVTMSQTRRRALLDWAQQANGWIVEDDYDSEFHYMGFRPAALKSIDAADRVFFAGSFSKTLLPSLRLGYLVTPAPFVRGADEAARLMHRGEAAFMQGVLAEYIADGHFSRHLRRMRSRYDLRRRALATALSATFGAAVQVRSQQGGLHLLAELRGYGNDLDVVTTMRTNGLWPSALSAQSIAPSGPQALMLGFANIPETSAAAEIIVLKKLLDES